MSLLDTQTELNSTLSSNLYRPAIVTTAAEQHLQQPTWRRGCKALRLNTLFSARNVLGAVFKRQMAGGKKTVVVSSKLQSFFAVLREIRRTSFTFRSRTRLRWFSSLSQEQHQSVCLLVHSCANLSNFSLEIATNFSCACPFNCLCWGWVQKRPRQRSKQTVALVICPIDSERPLYKRKPKCRRLVRAPYSTSQTLPL